MIKIHRDTEIRAISAPPFILTGRDKKVSDLILLKLIFNNIKDYGHSGVRFDPQDLDLILPLLIHALNNCQDDLEMDNDKD